MATGSGLLAIRAYLIEEWAFLILEIAWFLTAMTGLFTRKNSSTGADLSDGSSEE